MIAILIGVAIGMIGRETGAALWFLVRLAFSRQPPVLPPGDPPINVFHGTVFPDPKDPRWEECDGGFRFGDSNIRLNVSRLLVGKTTIEASSRVDQYRYAIGDAKIAAERALALASVDSNVKSAGYAGQALLPIHEVCIGGRLAVITHSGQLLYPFDDKRIEVDCGPDGTVTAIRR